jgi:Flp pilus assembly protein protease CpaA
VNSVVLRPIARFALLTLVYFLVMMAISFTAFYPPLFRSGANFLFHSLGSDRIAKFEEFDDPRGVFDTRMSVGSDRTGVPTFPSGQGLNSVRQGYAPTAVLIALVLATPIAWRRRWRVLLVGLVLIQGFVVLRIGVALLYGFSRVGYGDRRLLDLSGFSAWALRHGDQILAGDLYMTYLAPLLVWSIVTLRARELRSFWQSGDPQAVEPESPPRNAPCLCGSGRKFKHCCGKPAGR